MLEPEHETHPGRVAGVGDWLQAARKLGGPGGPVADAVGEAAREPRGVEPVGITADLVREASRRHLAGLGAPVGPGRAVAVEAL